MRVAPKYPKSSGFSMLELLVAMGILVVLIGIVAFTVSNITGGAKERETRVRLEALEGMLTELKTTTGLKVQPSPFVWVGGATPSQYNYDPQATSEPPIDIWRDGDPSNHAANAPPLPAPNPGPVTMEALRAG
ncbi:MAG: type II secretion system GspH family protein, partial [Phycisphaerae bacterium]|nr:type II secretion system GspH family protein [Phycisphaerae bacterium]